jgi:hypothetical protein
MTGLRLQALGPAAAFAALAWVTAGTGRVPAIESVVAALSLALALVPSGWLAPAGWRRRAAEATVLPVGFALVLMGEPTLRQMALPPLLVIAALATAVAALRGADARGRRLIILGLALAVRLGAGLGLTGYPLWRAALVIAAVALIAGFAGSKLAPAAALPVAVLAGVAPLERLAHLALVAVTAVAIVLIALAKSRHSERAVAGWSAGLVPCGLIAAALAPWSGIGNVHLLPTLGWLPAAAGGVAIVLTPFLPPALAGAAWLGVASVLSPAEPPPPDRPGFELTAVNPEVALPTSEGGLYILELSLANAAPLAQGTVVAYVRDVGTDTPIRAGIETAEWAHERADVRRAAAHSLPANAVWRPSGVGGTSTWAVAGRLVGQLSPGVTPRLVRATTLSDAVTVAVSTAGTSRPTPPRDWPAPSWILAAAIAIAFLQLAGNTWQTRAAVMPWLLLVTLALAVRLPVAPLRLLAERHCVDVVLAALLFAWFPAARVWLRRGRVFLAASALLVPLAVGTAHAMEPAGDAQYHLIVLRSLAEDHDLDLSNNYDLAHHPGNRIYVTPLRLHSPALDFLLVPGYVLGGVTGAIVTVALCGALLVAAVAHAARSLGVPPARRASLVGLLLLTYPLATYATQLWVEVPGALLAALALLCVTPPRKSVAGASLLSLAATSLKTRLALATFPVPILFLAHGRRRKWELLVPGLVVLATICAGLTFGVLVYGHALGPFRPFASLLPQTWRQPVIALGGLVFDAAGGLLFSAPLLLLALTGAPVAWKQGGAAVRGLLLAGVATVAALLSSLEWYGGGSPPLRYLVPLLPAFAICGAYLLNGSSRVRRLAWLALPASFVVWWALVTRPHLGFNPADGGTWFADALARRFAADARHLVPSFLRPSPATVLGPLIIVIIMAGLVLAVRRSPAAGRFSARAAVAVWLVAACPLLVVLTQRTDRVVELEDPEVTHLGGALEPPAGTFSRFTYPNGWRVGDGEGVEVPLNLPEGARVRLEGWLEGAAQRGAELALTWDGIAARPVAVRGAPHGSIALPAPDAGGHHLLRLVLVSPAGGNAVFDRLVVQR